jgi:NADH dehydrogenase [ubiquinone] 1 alpha subcomplex assembly factor 7
MTPLEGILLERTRAGPITFAAFMAAALYDDAHGYYRGGARTGWDGHFVTSPELDPAFGSLWARLLEEVWRACGAPERFDVVEIGPGEGSFAAGILEGAAPAFARALRLVLVEASEEGRSRQRRALGAGAPVSWVPSLDAVARVACGCVLGNEVLDNQPVHVLRRGPRGVEELWVVHVDGRLETRWGALSDPGLGPSARSAPTDVTVEVSPAAARLVRAAAGAVARGAVAFVDYGAERAELRARDGSLAAYGPEGVDADVLARPGARDITAHVDWTLVREQLEGAGLRTAGPVPQRRLLERLGLVDLDAELRRAHSDALARGDGTAAVRALSRRGGLAALTDPAGLGALGTVFGFAGIAPPPSLP